MKRYEVIVIGAGPAGLSAAIEAAKLGMCVVILDENARPGGQLFKQIHKFFGSKEHMARVRGFRIGEMLLKKAEEVGVDVLLNATVMGLFENKEITAMINGEVVHMRGDSVILATGASENVITFDGWTLPGVIGAGAAQTMMNLYGVKPGEKILMVGSGNVGLVVSYQLKQAGCDVVGIIDGAGRIGGYGVHAAKVARTGVPFFLSHVVEKAEGEDCVKGVTIVEVDKQWKPIDGTQKHFDVDTICLAVGLSPMSQLLKLAGCKTENNPGKGGQVPVCDKYGETSIPGIFAAGDVSGIEEASSAMITGRIAGLSAAKRAGYLSDEDFEKKYGENMDSLNKLRGGLFSHANRGRTDIETTDEGYALAKNLLFHGFVDEEELAAFPAAKVHKKGIHPVIECTQNIPCNPCQDACPKGCIKVGSVITNLPVLDEEVPCIGCGMCVASCSGQAIFLVNEDFEDHAEITIPYEFLPLPEVGDEGIALGRNGEKVCAARVVGIRTAKAMDSTYLLTMSVPKEAVTKARFFVRQEGC